MDGNEHITTIDLSETTDVLPDVVVWGTRAFIRHTCKIPNCRDYREAKTVIVDGLPAKGKEASC